MLFPRATGILLHPTSFPSRGGIGDFGPAAYEFADFLASARQGLWQVLPLGPPANGNSPYSSTSAFAGNPLLISLERLAERGWRLGVVDATPIRHESRETASAYDRSAAVEELRRYLRGKPHVDRAEAARVLERHRTL
jgi:4-alpha-glucanotransferase